MHFTFTGLLIGSAGGFMYLDAFCSNSLYCFEGNIIGRFVLGLFTIRCEFFLVIGWPKMVQCQIC
jgi:hypothetical protein